MPDTYDHITLMCRLKAAQRRNKELESGERYIQLEELHQKEYNVYEHKIEKLKKELAACSLLQLIKKTLLFLLQKQYDVKRSQTTGKKQAEDQAGSPATKGTAGKDRSLHSQLFFFLHLKKCSKTVLLKRLPGPS